jgi:hypothetical protein
MATPTNLVLRSPRPCPRKSEQPPGFTARADVVPERRLPGPCCGWIIVAVIVRVARSGRPPQRRPVAMTTRPVYGRPLVEVRTKLTRRPRAFLTLAYEAHLVCVQTGENVTRRWMIFVSADRTGPVGPAYVADVVRRSQVPLGGVGSFALAADAARAASAITTTGIERLTALKAYPASANKPSRSSGSSVIATLPSGVRGHSCSGRSR